MNSLDILMCDFPIWPNMNPWTLKIAGLEERLIFDYKLSTHPVLSEVFVKHKVI